MLTIKNIKSIIQEKLSGNISRSDCIKQPNSIHILICMKPD